MSKIIIIESCMDCKKTEWIRGKPRCTHPSMMVTPCIENDECPYPRVYNDGTRPFLEGCPLDDFEGE